MTSRAAFAVTAMGAAALIGLAAVSQARQTLVEGDAASAQEQLARARSQGEAARIRAEKLEATARQASAAAEQGDPGNAER